MADQQERQDGSAGSKPGSSSGDGQQKASPTTESKKGMFNVGIKRPQLMRFFSADAKRGKRLEYDKMSIEEKRKHYSCGDNFLTPADIPAWSQFHTRVPFPNSQKEPEYRVDCALNNTVSLWQGDITQLEVDAIVNAANSSLLGGGGVDGAIHRAASSALLAECRKLDGCSTGQAKITKGYRLPAKYVLHTVGPMNCHEEKLKNCYDCCFQLVLEHNIRSVAFPCIATGVYGYPHEDAARLALRVTRQWLELHKEKVDRIIFCVFQKIDYTVYGKLLHHYFPVESPVQEQALDAEEKRLPPLRRPILQTSVSAYGSGTAELETAPTGHMEKDSPELLSVERKELEPKDISQQPNKDATVADSTPEDECTSMSPSTPDVAMSTPDMAGSSSTPDVAGSSSTPDVAGNSSTPDVAGRGEPMASVEAVTDCKEAQGDRPRTEDTGVMDTSATPDLLETDSNNVHV